MAESDGAQRWGTAMGRSDGREGGGAAMAMAAQQRLRLRSDGNGDGGAAMGVAVVAAAAADVHRPPLFASAAPNGRHSLPLTSGMCFVFSYLVYTFST